MKPMLKTSMLLVVALGAAALVAAAHGADRHVCVERQPNANASMVGFELIDLMRREAWVTTDWTVEDYAAFSLPITSLNWFKNEPRIGLASQVHVLRSPDCDIDGEFTFQTMFGREFFHIANVVGGGRSQHIDGRISEARVVKYHRLQFEPGERVALLIAPDGARFIGVNRPVGASSVGLDLPQGWALEDRSIVETSQVDLFGEVRVIQLENGASYQGPIGDDMLREGT